MIGKYEDLKIFGYGGFREKFVFENEGRRRKNFGKWWPRSRAQSCHCKHGPCQLSVM